MDDSLMDEERVRTALWIEALYCREEEAAEYYYDLDAAGLRGDDPVEDLLDRIDVASAGWHRRGAPIDALASTAQLFSGLRGTGKTTALVRTAEALRERGHHVILVDAKRFHELSLPLDADGLLLLLFAGLGTSGVAYPWRRGPGTRCGRSSPRSIRPGERSSWT